MTYLVMTMEPGKEDIASIYSSRQAVFVKVQMDTFLDGSIRSTTIVSLKTPIHNRLVALMRDLNMLVRKQLLDLSSNL